MVRVPCTRHRYRVPSAAWHVGEQSVDVTGLGDSVTVMFAWVGVGAVLLLPLQATAPSSTTNAHSRFVIGASSETGISVGHPSLEKRRHGQTYWTLAGGSAASGMTSVRMYGLDR